jgi:hypothetical protein
MDIDREIQDVIQKHVGNAVAEVADLLKARVAGAIGLDSGRRRGRRARNGVKTKAPRVAKTRRVHRPGGGVTCIAPKCKNLSKGPRFHFLCEAHRTTKKAQWSKWAEAAKARR